MRYTLFLYNDESRLAQIDAAAMEQNKAAFGAYIGSLKEAGIFVDTDWLQPSSTATTITLKEGEQRIQDGPYADTKEQLGGYFVIDVPNLDVALEWAAKCPSARYGMVEVRPTAFPSS